MAYNKTFPEIDRVATQDEDDLILFHRAGQEYTQTRENWRGYTEYVALLSQTGTDAPTVTVIRNTLGITPTWAYGSTGVYTMTATGLLTANKTEVDISRTGIDYFIGAQRTSDNNVRVYTADNSNVAADDILNGNRILVRVYA